MNTFLNWLMPNRKITLIVTLKSGVQIKAKRIEPTTDGIAEFADHLDRGFKDDKFVGHVTIANHTVSIQEVAHYHVTIKRSF